MPSERLSRLAGNSYLVERHGEWWLTARGQQMCRYKLLRPLADKERPLPSGNTGKWDPNSPTKGKGVPSVPTGATWNPSPSSGPTLKSSGGRR
jgi:hypothetical protein